MTLPELAALAAEKVSGFTRPMRVVCGCGGCVNCPSCGGFDYEWDDSPAALLMAVFKHQLKGARKLETDRGDILIRHGVNWSRVKAGETQEFIANAALVALLRAHGVEVGDA